MAELQAQGQWYAQGQSKAQNATMHIEGDMVRVVSTDGIELLRISRSAVSIPSRLGNTARHIYFDGGQKFESLDNEVIDNWMQQYDKSGSSNLIYQLESHWRLVFLSVLILAAFVWGSIQYGIPFVSKEIAKRLPHEASVQASKQSLSFLDSHYFEHSLLFPAQRERLTQVFEQRLNQQGKYQLLFRSSEVMGANALALPDGTIVMTDDLVKLAENDEELLAVLAHEIGHVEYQHGMRGLIQNSLVVFIAMALTGDSSGVAEVFIGLPLLLVESAYSREFEMEADQYAHDYLQSQQLPLTHFPAILGRITLNAQCMQYYGLQLKDDELQEFDCHSKAGLEQFKQEVGEEVLNDNDEWLDYLSSHPSYDERSALFQ